MGANLRLITIVAFGIIMSIIWLRYFTAKKSIVSNLFLTISASNKELSLTQAEEIVSKYFSKYEIKRFEEDKTNFETAYLIETKDIQTIDKFKQEIQAVSNDIRISFIDNKVI